MYVSLIIEKNDFVFDSARYFAFFSSICGGEGGMLLKKRPRDRIFAWKRRQLERICIFVVVFAIQPHRRIERGELDDRRKLRRKGHTSFRTFVDYAKFMRVSRSLTCCCPASRPAVSRCLWRTCGCASCFWLRPRANRPSCAPLCRPKLPLVFGCDAGSRSGSSKVWPRRPEVPFQLDDGLPPEPRVRSRQSSKTRSNRPRLPGTLSLIYNSAWRGSSRTVSPLRTYQQIQQSQ